MVNILFITVELQISISIIILNDSKWNAIIAYNSCIFIKSIVLQFLK